MEKRDVDNSIGDRVKVVRKSTGLSQKKFAEQLETSIDEIRNIEAKRLREPNRKKPFLKLICYEFNISREWLFFGEGEMESDKTPLETFSEKEKTTKNGIRLIQALLDKPIEDREAFYNFCIYLFEGFTDES